MEIKSKKQYHEEKMVGSIHNVLVRRVNFYSLFALTSKYFFSSSDNFYVDDFARFSTLDSKDKTAAVANSMTYLTKRGNIYHGL